MLNYQTVDFLKSQLREQYDRSGYSYEKPQDVDRILEAQAAKLAAAGVSSIYDIGLKEVPNTNTINQVFRIGNDLYYRQEEDEGPGYNVKIDPSRVLDIAADTPVREETEGGQPIFQDRFQVTIAEDPTKYLINKQTGQEIPKVELKPDWKENPEGFVIRKPEPIVSRNGYERYGFDTSVEGQADYSVQFVNGNPLFLPAYKSTKTDLTPYLAIAAVVGAPYLFGTTAAPAAAGTTGTTGTTLATSTAVPGSLQATLPSLGVQTAATTAASTAVPGSFQAALPGLLSSTAAGAPIYFAEAVPAEQLAYPAREVAANYTPVPGSFQEALPGLGVETAASAAPFTAAPGSFQAALPSLLGTAGATSLSALDTLRAANTINNLLNPQAIPNIQQQAGLGGGGGQARGVDYSGLLPTNVVGLLPLAERYRRSLI